MLAICEGGEHFIGSVSAGCVEHEVIELAQSSIQDKQTRWVKFGPSHGMPWEISLTCGGRITVRVDPFIFDEQILPDLTQLLDTHTFGLLVSNNEKQLLATAEAGVIGDTSNWSQPTLTKVQDALRQQSNTTELETEDGKILIRSLEKPKRLFVFGAVHVTTHLVGMAQALNYQVIVIDPREIYAQSDRFTQQPDQLLCSWPNEALKDFEITSSDFAIMITHDPKIDDNALSIFLNTECKYIGALGSKRSHSARLRRLSKQGFNEEQLSRIHGPVGLDIGSRTPAEIAVSIIAQIIQERNRPNA